MLQTLALSGFPHLENLQRHYLARAQPGTESPNQLGPALSKLLELDVKPANEATSAAVRSELPVLFAANVELDKSSAHLLFTKAEFRG